MNAKNKKTLTLKQSPVAKKASGQPTVVVHKKAKRIATPESDSQSDSKYVSNLSDKERLTRINALEKAPQTTTQEKEKLKLLKAEEDRRRILEKEAKDKQRQNEKELRRKEEQQRKQTEEEARKKAEAIAEREEIRASQRREEQTHETPIMETPPARSTTSPSASESREEERSEKNKTRRSPGRPRIENKRGGAGKLNLNAILDSSEDERTRSMAALKRMRAKEKQKLQAADSVREKIIRDVIIPDTVAVGELANRMAERTSDVIKALMNNGIIAGQHQTIDGDTAELIVHEFGHRSKRVSLSDVEDILIESEVSDPADLRPRPPVVTVMGHVDHGKTSLLDAFRQTGVAAGEAGGITQHIGAYQVHCGNKQRITFIDTPGHAAFTQMRARGAKVTDIVVLVVAADDGVQPQTIEAIKHAEIAHVPVIVAVNKCDKPTADPQKIYTQLLKHGVQTEAMGGEVQAIEVSAKEGLHLDKLLEAILLQAEILELKGNPQKLGRGVVIEARLEKGRGPIATILVQSGVIKVADIFVAGKEWGKVRALLDENSKQATAAEISKPVEVLGLNGTPQAGDDFIVVENEAKAREISEYRTQKAKSAEIIIDKRGTLEQMFDQAREGTLKTLNLIVKADVQGSLEAIKASTENISTDEVEAKIIHAGVGGITESDIALAQSVGALIIGFNVRANAQAREFSKREKIEIRFYSVIYNLLDDIKLMLTELLAPAVSEDILGYAEVRNVFNVSKVGKAAGCMITEGNIKRDAEVRLLRDDTVIFEGRLKQLKRFKEDVREVQKGYECGMTLENFDDIRNGDMIECYQLKHTARSL